ncbi:hypothetical protein WA026_009440 [Henosepilachna vigintioctopunctata]|uniref:Ribosomal protein L6 n=1 Tax=Henosepilachna vigintioctopunctata TaxID=420089 RepID=A0AAW1U6U0_9CUCU
MKNNDEFLKIYVKGLSRNKIFLLLLLFQVNVRTMKQIVTNQTVKIPKGLTVSVKSRVITVKGQEEL